MIKTKKDHLPLAAHELTSRVSLKLAARRGDKSTRNRVKLYMDYLERMDGDLLHPEIEGWMSELIDRGMAAATITAYLSSVRATYRRWLKYPSTRDLFYNIARTSGAVSPADQKAFVDELVIRIKNAIDPEVLQVPHTKVQDLPDSAQLRLSSSQAQDLLAAPGITTLMGIRDTAIIALLLTTGIREGELCALDVSDLHQRLDGELALHVRNGKGRKSRLVPYGEMDWSLELVDRWLITAEIHSGPVFRGFYKGSHHLRSGRMSVRTVERVLGSYQIKINDQTLAVKAHDCRRTYARLQYEASMDLVAIQQNLGHESMKTTLSYIGELDISKRRPKEVISFDFPTSEV